MGGTGIAAESYLSEQDHCSRRVAASDALGWRWVLAREYEDPDETEGFTTSATPDLLVVMNISGSFTIQSARGGGHWARARYHPGSIGVSPPLTRSTLRWRREPSPQRRSLHIFLAADLVRDTADSLGRPSLARALPGDLLLEDPVVLAAARALHRALASRADPLRADAVAVTLASRLLGAVPSQRGAGTVPPMTLTMPPAALARVSSYLQENLAAPVALDDLAAVAQLSKYHFARVFVRTLGVTPYRYLVRLRMTRAAELLQSTRLDVWQIGTRCGYASPAQFSSAFRRHHGVTPTGYRREVQRSRVTPPQG